MVFVIVIADFCAGGVGLAVEFVVGGIAELLREGDALDGLGFLGNLAISIVLVACVS